MGCAAHCMAPGGGSVRPRVGITCASTPPAAYVAALEACGVEVVPLAPGTAVGEAAARDPSGAGLTGLLFSGGVDITPSLYGEARVHATTNIDGARDALELPLACAALRQGMPVLGICRGIQVLNVAAGGTLWQDIPSECPGDTVHMEPAAGRDRTRRLHAVRVAPGTRLARIVGEAALPVNSIHHQAVRAPGAGLAVVATAPDGVIEALEADGPTFVVAVQWHPEDLCGTDPRHAALFAAFVAVQER